MLAGVRGSFLVLAVAVLLLAGCGSAVPVDSASPSPGASAAGFTVPTRLFSSPELGISLRYPATWRQNTLGSLKTLGTEALVFKSPTTRAPQAVVEVMVTSGRVLLGKPPLPFTDAKAIDLRLATIPPEERVLRAGFTELDGLRLTEIESDDTVLTPANKGLWHTIELQSGSGPLSVGPSGSRVDIGLQAPVQDWRAEKATLLAVLATTRFTRPKG